MPAASLETTLELWSATLRQAKQRIRPLGSGHILYAVEPLTVGLRVRAVSGALSCDVLPGQLASFTGDGVTVTTLPSDFVPTAPASRRSRGPWVNNPYKLLAGRDEHIQREHLADAWTAWKPCIEIISSGDWKHGWPDLFPATIMVDLGSIRDPHFHGWVRLRIIRACEGGYSILILEPNVVCPRQLILCPYDRNFPSVRRSGTQFLWDAAYRMVGLLKAERVHQLLRTPD